MSKSVAVKLSKAEIQQLLSYLEERDSGSDAGWFFGNREAFESRHKSLREKLILALTVKSSGEGK